MARRLPILKTVQPRLRELIAPGRSIGMLYFYLDPAYRQEVGAHAAGTTDALAATAGAIAATAGVFAVAADALVTTAGALAATVEATLQGQLGTGFREGDLLARGADGLEWFVFLASPPRSKHGLTRRDLQEVERRVARELRASIREALASVPRASLPPLRSGAAVLEFDPTLSLAVQLDEARTEARLHGEVSRLLDDQISGLNHKIRTPLTTIKGVIEILKHDAEAAPRFIKTLEAEVERIQHLLGQFSLLTRVQSGLFDWTVQNVDVLELLRRVTGSMQPLADQMGVVFEEKADARSQYTIRGAVELLEEAFRQVLDNAVRYGARGKRVEVTVLPSVECVTVRVTDHGPGIARSDLPFIFQPFYVTGQDPDTQSQGGGLGLCLARGVVEVHGGELECDSGRAGTTMTMRFPRDFERAAPKVSRRGSQSISDDASG